METDFLPELDFTQYKVFRVKDGQKYVVAKFMQFSDAIEWAALKSRDPVFYLVEGE